MYTYTHVYMILLYDAHKYYFPRISEGKMQRMNGYGYNLLIINEEPFTNEELSDN